MITCLFGSAPLTIAMERYSQPLEPTIIANEDYGTGQLDSNVKHLMNPTDRHPLQIRNDADAASMCTRPVSGSITRSVRFRHQSRHARRFGNWKRSVVALGDTVRRGWSYLGFTRLTKWARERADHHSRSGPMPSS
jgi:hypothetical protein